MKRLQVDVLRVIGRDGIEVGKHVRLHFVGRNRVMAERLQETGEDFSVLTKSLGLGVAFCVWHSVDLHRPL